MSYRLIKRGLKVASAMVRQWGAEGWVWRCVRRDAVIAYAAQCVVAACRRVCSDARRRIRPLSRVGDGIIGWGTEGWVWRCAHRDAVIAYAAQCCIINYTAVCDM